jgi:hypothetical protein
MVAALGMAFSSSMVALNPERNVLAVAGHRKIRAPKLALHSFDYSTMRDYRYPYVR